MKNEMTRKEFLQQLALMGIAAIGAGSLLSSCGKKEEATETAAKPDTAAKKATDPCGDVSGLTDAEVQMRTTLQYAAVSPDPEKQCDNCKFWTAPEAGSPCGTCQLIKGPIHPKGYCTSWFQMET